MPKKNGVDAAHNIRAWKILPTLALLWARKGRVFKRRLMMELRVVPKFLKNLRHNTPRDFRYGERELSFDKTPIFHVKMNRLASMRFFIPCITPQVDFDYDFDDHEVMSEDDLHKLDGSVYDGMRRSFLLKNGDEEEEYEYEYVETCDQEKIPAEEEEINMRAEEFITKFRQQMRLQRQISYLQYH